MREIFNSLAQLTAVIMILITLAVSTAVFGQWVGGDSAHDNSPALLINAR